MKPLGRVQIYFESCKFCLTVKKKFLRVLKKSLKNIWRELFSLVQVPSANMEEFMTHDASRQQETIKMLWLHFRWAVMSPFFIKSREL